MRFWLVAFRVASALLLTNVTVDMIGLDILEQVIQKTQSTQNLPCPDNGISDDCFCCCAHMMLIPRVRLVLLRFDSGDAPSAQIRQIIYELKPR